MVALILAAGYATRLYPYTLNMPKPLLPVGGKPIIKYIEEQIMTLPEISKIVVVSNDKFYGKFCEWAKENSNSLIKVLNDGSNSEDNRLGAIKDIEFGVFEEKIEDDIVIIAGDNLFNFKLLDYYIYFRRMDKSCICVKQVNDINALRNFGVCELDENGKVVGFAEKPPEPKSNLAAFAVYMFKRDTLKLITEFLNENDNKDAPGYFIEWLHKKTEVYAYEFNGECYDIGTVAAYEKIRDAF